MSTMQTLNPDVFDVMPGNGDTAGLFIVLKNGEPLLDREGAIRTFITRASARKRITRERRGDYHR